MLKKKMSTLCFLSLAMFWGIAALPCSADEKGEGSVAEEKAEGAGTEALEKAFKETKIPLEKGLSAAQKMGKPISAKFEVEDGKLQLSVYTAKADSFSEVVVNHKTGKIEKSEAITGGDDLTAAKAQGEAMAKAKETLEAALNKALKGNKGYKATSVTPKLANEHPVAEITLMKGDENKVVTEKLD